MVGKAWHYTTLVDQQGRLMHRAHRKINFWLYLGHQREAGCQLVIGKVTLRGKLGLLVPWPPASWIGLYSGPLSCSDGE
jgi:hypothetical protein